MPMPWWFPFGGVPEISPDELQRRIAAGGVQLLDVRTRGEWRDGHIAGAINHPIQELPRTVSGLPLDREHPVVAICRSAHRSVPAVRLLQRAGYTDVVQLAGGMNAWWGRELPTASADEPDRSA